MSYIGNEPVISATRTITEVVASGGQTVFYPNGGYTVGYLDVAINGSLLQASDFVATNGTSVTLNVACGSGDDVKLIAWGTFTTSSSYTQAQVDSKIGASQFGFKNRIINGAMMIDQRNAGASVTPTNGQYLVDRFGAGLTQASKFTAQQSSTSTAGFANSLLVTSSSSYSVGSTDRFWLYQGIEGLNVSDLAWGTAAAATITLSFWVRSSLTGTFGGSLQNSAQNRSYPFSFTINSANTFEYKTITIAGDQSGTWLTTNGVGIYLNIGLGVGSTYSGTAGTWTGSTYFSATGATSVVGTSGATFYITGVQLEKGSTATSFDYRPYGTELALCQRYFETSYVQGVAVGTNIGSDSNSQQVLAAISNSIVWGGSVGFKVTKRAIPTLTFYARDGASGYWYWGQMGVNESKGGTSPNMTTTTGFGGMSSGTYGAGANSGYGQWTASAEL